jgi:hypothetical protein
MLKLLWLLCLPALYSSGCTYFLITSMISYFSFNKDINIHLKNDQPAIFPTVSFCFNIKNALNLNNIDFYRINYDLKCKDKPELYFESF